MDVIPLDATLVRGSHGTIIAELAYHAVFSSNHGKVDQALESIDIYEQIWRCLLE